MVFRAGARVAVVFSGIAASAPALLLGDPTAATAPAALPAPVSTEPSTLPLSRPATQPGIASSPEIERFLSQFLSDNWRLREQAQDGLSAVAEAAEPRLRQFIAATPSAEARARAQLVLNQLDAVRKLGPTLVTLHLKDASPRDAFAELSRQCSLPIVAQGESLWRRVDRPSITLDVAAEPFWAVMRRVCTTFGVRAIFTGNAEEPGKITLIRDTAGEMSSPAAFNGSFMMLVTSLSRRNAFDGADEADDKKPANDKKIKTGPAMALTASITFFADPKWRIVEHPEQAAIESAADDQGNALPRIEPMRMQVFKLENPIWLMRTEIRHVPAGCKKLSRLKGNFRIIILEESGPLEVPNILAVHNAIKKVGGRTLQIKEVVKDGETYKVRLTFFRNGLSTQDWRQQRETQGIVLQDEKGRPLTRRGFTADENGEQVDYEISFFKDDPSGQANSGAGAPAKLIARLPLEPREVTVPFEFKDLAIEK